MGVLSLTPGGSRSRGRRAQARQALATRSMPNAVRIARYSKPVADITAESSAMSGTEIGGDMIPRLLDEVPVLALAACYATGTTVIRDAQELRVKESDRISATVEELSRLGADIQELPDGMVIRGTGGLKGASGHSHGDHRLAMTLGVAGLLASGQTDVSGAEDAGASYPGFWDDLNALATDSPS